MSKIKDNKFKKLGEICKFKTKIENLDTKVIWKGDYVTESETVFHKQLRLVTESLPIQILTRISLKDLFYVKNSWLEENQGEAEQFENIYIDFLLCEEDTMIPLVAIKIDEKNSDKKFVTSLFEEVGLNIVHVEAKENYDVLELIKIIESNIDRKNLIK